MGISVGPSAGKMTHQTKNMSVEFHPNRYKSIRVAVAVVLTQCIRNKYLSFTQIFTVLPMQLSLHIISSMIFSVIGNSLIIMKIAFLLTMIAYL